jgi:hypothetical protein
MQALLIVFLTAPLSSAKLTTLKEITNPQMMEVKKNQLYLIDQYSLFIYSLDTFQLLFKIGNKGQGPSEFIAAPHFQILSNGFFLYDVVKWSRYNEKGRLIKEGKLDFPVTKINQLGNNFITRQWTLNQQKRFSEIIVYNQNFEKIASLFKKERKYKTLIRTIKDTRFVSPILTFKCRNDRIYLVNGYKGFYIEVFDKNGRLLYVIKKDYPPIKIQEEDKKELIEEFKKKPFLKNRWSFFKKMAGNLDTMFPEYYPAIRDVFVTEDRIYVNTYIRKKDKEEYIVLDLKGDFLKKVFLPRADSRLIAFDKGRFYFLKENEESVDWELHCKHAD